MASRMPPETFRAKLATDTDTLTDEEQAAIKSHDLRSPIVRMALAGYLSAELAQTYGVPVPANMLTVDIADYVMTVETLLDKVTALYASGYRVPQRNQPDRS